MRPDSTMFVPQSPYVPSGTLPQLFFYPESQYRFNSGTTTDAQLMAPHKMSNLMLNGVWNKLVSQHLFPTCQTCPRRMLFFHLGKSNVYILPKFYIIDLNLQVPIANCHYSTSARWSHQRCWRNHWAEALSFVFWAEYYLCQYQSSFGLYQSSSMAVGAAKRRRLQSLLLTSKPTLNSIIMFENYLFTANVWEFHRVKLFFLLENVWFFSLNHGARPACIDCSPKHI